MDTMKFEEFRSKIKENVGRVIVGKEDTIDKIIVCFYMLWACTYRGCSWTWKN